MGAPDAGFVLAGVFGVSGVSNIAFPIGGDVNWGIAVAQVIAAAAYLNSSIRLQRAPDRMPG